MQIWSLGVAATANDPHSIQYGLFLNALNNMLDSYSSLVAEMDNLVPESALLLLYLVAIFTLGLIGCRNGLDDKPNRVTMILCSIVIAFVIIVILDLDTPYNGLILVDDRNFLILQKNMSIDDK